MQLNLRRLVPEGAHRKFCKLVEAKNGRKKRTSKKGNVPDERCLYSNQATASENDAAPNGCTDEEKKKILENTRKTSPTRIPRTWNRKIHKKNRSFADGCLGCQHALVFLTARSLRLRQTRGRGARCAQLLINEVCSQDKDQQFLRRKIAHAFMCTCCTRQPLSKFIVTLNGHV